MRKPVHTPEQMTELMEEWLKAELHQRRFQGGDIVLARVEGSETKGVLRVEENQPLRVLNVVGESDTLIGIIAPRKVDYVFEPEGWSPPAVLEGPQFLQLARQAWMLYYHQQSDPQ